MQGWTLLENLGKGRIMGAQQATHERLTSDEAAKGASDRGFGLVFAVVSSALVHNLGYAVQVKPFQDIVDDRETCLACPAPFAHDACRDRRTDPRPGC